LKYLLAIGVLFILITPNVIFAYDGDVFGGYDGNFTRYAFIQQASDINLARNVLRNAFGTNTRIEKLFSIGEDDVDEEDVQMINDLEAYIPTQYRLENGDAYSYTVRRGETNNGFDGWIVFSHYLNSNGWYHYVYYFSIN
ncbi:MAG: hypothetical protein LBG58_08675, partial [Planctomycetaceae bacterium]|nr:hypothetical protein [Planctomycetaceae bacterium]